MLNRFRLMVEKHSERHALDICRTINPIRYTYTELHQYTNRLANYINRSVIKPKDLSQSRIVCVDDAPERVIPSFVSIMKVGGVYAPLSVIKPTGNDNIKWQHKRLRNQLARLQPSLILTTLMHEPLLKKFNPQFNIKCLDAPEVKDEIQDCSDDLNDYPRETWKYVTATSGTTGEPKLIQTSSQCLLSRAEGFRRGLLLTEEDRVAQLFPFHYDASLMEMIMTFHVGAALCPVPYEVAGHEFVKSYIKAEITTATLFPHTLPWFKEGLKEKSYRIPKIISMGAKGDQQIKQFMESKEVRPDVLIDGYGPSETGAAASLSVVDGKEENIVHWQPFDGMIYRVYPRTANDKKANETKVLCEVSTAEDGARTQIGEFKEGDVGELYIADRNGVGEYLDSDLDAKKFTTLENLRFYKTDDKVILRKKTDSKGQESYGIEFDGRFSRTVKNNVGRWINFENVERNINEFFKIHKQNFQTFVEAAVDFDANKRVVAVLAFKDKSAVEAIAKKNLLQQLHQYLLENMQLDMIPMLWAVIPRSNPAPDELANEIRNGVIVGEILPPSDHYYKRKKFDYEETLEQIWRGVLNIPETKPISIHNQFFNHLGGTSLDYFDMTTRVREAFGEDVNIDYAEFKEHQTIAYLGRYINYVKGITKERMHSFPAKDASQRKLPLFLIHAGDGKSYSHEFVHKHFKDRDTYTIEASGVQDDSLIDETVEEAAGRYARQIVEKLKLQDIRECIIGGWSAGGVLGVEIQRQLHLHYKIKATNLLIDSESPQLWAGLQPDEYNIRICGFMVNVYKTLNNNEEIPDRIHNEMKQHADKSPAEQINMIIRIVLKEGELKKRRELLTSLRIAKAVTIHYPSMFSQKYEDFPADTHLFIAAPTMEEFKKPVQAELDRGTLGWELKKEDERISVIPIRSFNPQKKQTPLDKTSLHLEVLQADLFFEIFNKKLQALDENSSMRRIQDALVVPVFMARTQYFLSLDPDAEEKQFREYTVKIHHLMELNKNPDRVPIKYRDSIRIFLDLLPAVKNSLSTDYKKQIDAATQVSDVLKALKKSNLSELKDFYYYALIALHNLLGLIYRNIKDRDAALIEFTHCMHLIIERKLDKIDDKEKYDIVMFHFIQNQKEVLGAIYANIGLLIEEFATARYIHLEFDPKKAINNYVKRCNAANLNYKLIIHTNDIYSFGHDFGLRFHFLAGERRGADAFTANASGHSLGSLCQMFRKQLDRATERFNDARPGQEKNSAESEKDYLNSRLKTEAKRAEEHYDNCKNKLLTGDMKENQLPLRIKINVARLHKAKGDYQIAVDKYNEILESKDMILEEKKDVMNNRIRIRREIKYEQMEALWEVVRIESQDKSKHDQTLGKVSQIIIEVRIYIKEQKEFRDKLEEELPVEMSAGITDELRSKIQKANGLAKNAEQLKNTIEKDKIPQRVESHSPGLHRR